MIVYMRHLMSFDKSQINSLFLGEGGKEKDGKGGEGKKKPLVANGKRSGINRCSRKDVSENLHVGQRASLVSGL